MKSITIICLPSSDTKIIFSDKSLAKENNATKLIVDYSNTPVADWIKVINFKMSDGTEQKVELNTLPVVEMLLTSAFTVAGDLEIAPYAISSNDPNPNRMQFKPRLIGNEYFTDVFINSAEEHPDIFDQIFVDINNLKENKADQEYVDATFQEKEVGKGLSQENYTTEEKAKLNGVESGAQVNTVNSVAGKTGDVTLSKADVGLNNVNNTADLNKPVSHPQQAALDDKAPLNHNHTKEQITNFAHVHLISEVVNLQTELNGKANTVHTHVKADITDFAHNHPISEVVNLQTALNGKANTTTTVNNKSLSSNIIINASDVPNTPTGNISATTVQNAINELDTEKVDKLMATNLVTNGDFSNGITGWRTSGSTISATNNILSIIGNGAALSPGAMTLSSLAYASGKKIYSRGKVRVTNSNSNRLSIILFDGSNYYVGAQQTTIVNGTWYDISGVTTLLAGGSILEVSPQHRYVDAATSNGKVMEVQYVLAIDLTAIFGAGNEPTKEQMDKLLSVYPNSWFNGTSEIGSIGALMRATLGVQVVTPTLLNSRTGNAQYVFSNDGLVIFRGTASGGSLNTNIFVLPENIRPAATRTFPISANNAFGVITVAANGEVRQTVGALTNVFLDGIVFKVGV